MAWKIYTSYTLLLATITISAVIPITISQSEESNDKVSESWGFTDIKISKLKFTWTISNYKYCCQNAAETLRSPTFSTNDGCKWYLEITPKGEVGEENKNDVALFLYSVNCNASTIVKLGILNSNHELVNNKEFSYEYLPTKGWGYISFIPQINLETQEDDLLSDNKLTIICEITATLGRENSLRKFVQPKSHFLENFGVLLENEILSDVTLRAGRKEFKAHKAILAARSPVFKALLEDDTVKRRDKVVGLTNVEPKALSEMLRYIYTDEAFNLEKVAPKLLAVAENYELDGLKTLCENTLRSNISIENAINFFVLGDAYRAADLKNDARKFIVAHISHLTNTTGFKSLILTQPRLLEEAFELFG